VEAPYEAGVLSGAFLNDGLNMTKFVRYLAGLSENVYLDDTLTRQAQHGAVLLRALNQLTHTPSKPDGMDEAFYEKGKASCASSNLYQAYTGFNLDRAVKGFCDDSDSSNIDRVGHRRWILHPSLQKLGFGKSGGYIAMQVFDTSNKTDKVDMEYVPWPGGNFPNSFFDSYQAWSVSLNPKIFDIGKCKPEVTLVTAGDKWILGDDDKDKSAKGKFFNFDKGGYGWAGCVIFRPDNLVSIKDAAFTVTVSGLVDQAGNYRTIKYTVNFFTL
jgi:hypothetical protein